VSLYIDTSALLKVFFVEPESNRVVSLVSGEAVVTVSSLARLEALVQVKRREASGSIKVETADKLMLQIEARLRLAPFHLRKCPGDLIEVAEKQAAASTAYCPTRDRLHLAAMQVFGLRRLLTNDDMQAAAARALGYEVLMPR
jgi:predicted nucleic acid-binding protein